MEFRRASDRLNFFFSPYRWALRVDAPLDGSLDAHLQVLGTAFRHWGSKLEFSFQLNAQARFFYLIVIALIYFQISLPSFCLSLLSQPN